MPFQGTGLHHPPRARAHHEVGQDRPLPVRRALISVLLALSTAQAACAAPRPTASRQVSASPSTEAAPTPTPVALPSALEPGASPSGITAMAWLDGDTAVFAGRSGSTATAWRTADHGATWTSNAVGPGSIVDFAVLGQEVWASFACPVDSSGTCASAVLHSADGGRSWAPISDSAVDSPSFESSLDGWGVTPGPNNGDPKPLLRTADAGRTWVAVAAPCGSTGQPVAVSFAAPGHGWLACDEDLGAGSAVKGVLETGDSGDHWVVRASVVWPDSGPDVGSISSGGYLRGIRMTAGGRGLSWFGRGGAARTLDGGVHWLGTSDADPDVVIPFAAWVLDDSRWFLLVTDADAGNATFLEETTDGGATWARLLRFP
jgi:photosystem II stability/assembly factor-like uncharacterized protein